MNIKARILARKILLVYFYEQYFFEIAWKRNVLLDDIDKIQKIVANHEERQNEITPSDILSSDYYEDMDHEITYIIENYFENYSPKQIDFDYIKTVGPHFSTYKNVVREKVNEYAVSFTYDSMDIMDRVLFVLWYVEFKEMKTPKEVVLNEMIELAKRYGDESSPKLINGIWHKLLNEEHVAK